MEPVLSSRARRSGRTTALAAAVSLLVSPLLVAPAAADPVPEPSVTVESTAIETTAELTDVVAPPADQLAITGDLVVGQVLAVDPRRDLWTPADVELTFAYRWFADGAPIDGAEGDSLVPAPATLGQTVSVEITGTAPEGAVDGAPSASVVVQAAGPVAAGQFVTGELEVTGGARVGQTLTATAGAWTPDVALAIEWRRGDVVVGTGTTYVPGPADVGSALTVVASGAAESYEPASVTATTSVVLAGTISAPTPTLSGTVQVGRTVTAVPGTWNPAATLSYRWLLAGAPVSGATLPTYTPTAADAGKALAVEVTGTVDGYESATRVSAAKTVAAGTLTAPTPLLSGTVRVGSKVTAKPGTWTSGTTLSYQWYASGTAISGATASAYTPTSGVKGKVLTVKVTGKKSGYTTVTKASAGKTVAAGVFSAPTPKISGTVRVGNKVAVSRGTWTPSASSYRYQWRVNGVAISGATGSTYTIPAKYAGKKLTVSVRGARSGYTTRTVTSAGATILRIYSRTSAPRISGTARIGSTLKVSSVGTWTPSPSSYRYQWRANGTAIKGATGRSFRLTAAQYGKRITVTVQGIRSGYYPSSRTSAATSKVGAPAPVLTTNGTFRVGTQIKPGTYIAPGSASGCKVKRLNGSKSVIASGITYGRTIVTIKSTDAYFSTSGCGTWRKYYSYGSVRTSTAVDGIYKVGTSAGQLKPGLYYTDGPAFSDDVCYAAALSDFTMATSSIIEASTYEGSGYWRILPDDVGFEAYGCSWRRVSS